MWKQIAAIAWAQFRIGRNHLPRAGLGTVVASFALLVWYGVYAALAVLLAWRIPQTPTSELREWLPIGLLAVFLFWQIIPLFTLSSGWSLDLNKLRIHPVSDATLLGIEMLLRLTTAPEMLIVLTGAIAGLFRHAEIVPLLPLAILAFVPLNLFLQLGIRDLILHSFERNRFRELFALVVISVAVTPQLLLRTGLGLSLKPYFLALAQSPAAPWYNVASLSLGRYRFSDIAFLLFWTALSFGFAFWMFSKSLLAEDSFQPVSIGNLRRDRARFTLPGFLARVPRDPLAALVQKEFQSLIRMPRFRVLFGMSCILGLVVFVPAALNGGDPAAHFMHNNLLPVVNVYGLLLLSDTLLLNAFGLDRGASQAYFVMPLSLDIVLKAKNLTAIAFVALQSAVILLVAAVARAGITWSSVASGLLASAVVTVFLLTVGNWTSLSMPRPIDPKQTFKRQAGAKMQIWFLGCTLGLFLLVGFAFLARYALQSDWALLGVLSFELLVGLVVYCLGLASATKCGTRDREKIVQVLSRSGSPVSLG
jgi:hypothetical protein